MLLSASFAAWLIFQTSLAPFLVVFALALALRAVLTLRAPDTRWSIAQNFTGLVLAMGIVAVMLLPLAIFSATHFGKPLFNYTKYWMWMDDFMTEAWPFQDKVSRPGSTRTASPRRDPVACVVLSASWIW